MSAMDDLSQLIDSIYEQINVINFAAHDINQKFISGNDMPVTQVVVKDSEWKPIMDAIAKIREIS